MPQAELAVHDRDHVVFEHDLNVLIGHDLPGAQEIDIAGNANHAVRIVADQVGLDQVPSDAVGFPGLAAGRLATATANFHRRMVELSGNATLSMIAGMLHEITERHTAEAIRKRKVPDAQYQKLLRSYRRLIELLRAGDADEAEAHWRRQLDIAGKLTLHGQESVKVRDVMD